MSSAVVSTSAALGRPFVFDEEAVPDVRSLSGATKKPAGSEDSPQESLIARLFQSTIKNRQSTMPLVTSASRLDIRPAPEMVSIGVPAIDTQTGGLPRGCLTEICGPASSGRTTLLLAALAAATRRGEFCAVVDANDTLDPQSAAASGVELERLLWVRCGAGSAAVPTAVARARPRCEEATLSRQPASYRRYSLESEHRLEQVLRATDLLLESGGFGLIVLDLGDVPPQSAHRIPLTTWFRFRRAVEHKPTILLAIEQRPIAGSCSSLMLQLGSQSKTEDANRQEPSVSSRKAAKDESTAPQCRVALGKDHESRRDGTDELQIANPSHTHLLTELNINAEICSRLQRKPVNSITFATKTAWAG